MPPRREFEFGVPFPGEILSAERWTRTGWKDDGRPWDWEARFGRRAPRVVDLGCGNGRYLIGSGLARPGIDHLGVDLVQVAVDHAARRANRRGLRNVRFVRGDAAVWAWDRLAPATLDEIHLYHPQPYYEADAPERRLLTPDFLERCWTLLRPGGGLVAQTDNKAYWAYLTAALPKWFELRILPGPWPDAPAGRTRREIVARSKGLSVWRLESVRRGRPLDVAVPRPDFDANRPRFRRPNGSGRGRRGDRAPGSCSG
jgi:tRNA (guanine-N7-)-methyltransferase